MAVLPASPRLLALLFLAATVATTACGPQAPSGLKKLHLCTGDEGPADAYCGTLTVFEDHEARTGRRIPLAIVVLPATSDDYRPDPLVFLAGGPGQGAARMAPLVEAAFKRVQRHRDIVLVDQRGTGRSHPLNCPDENSLRDAFADDAATVRRLDDCLKALDADVRQYTTPIAMDDLDEVRAFLGYARINLYGGSYGTRAALVYMRQHGDHVRSAILDGVAPTNMRLPLFAARDAARALDQVIADCEHQPACETSFPGVRDKVSTLLARLDRAPVQTRLTHPRTGVVETVDVTARAMANTLLSALYSPITASMVPLLVERATSDDFQTMVAVAFAGDSDDNMSVGMQLSVLCSEDAHQISPDDVSQAVTDSVFGRHLLAGQIAACASWPKGTVPSDYSAPISSDVPTLVLSGDLDPVTPPAWGETVTKHLRRSRHFVAKGTGHGVATTPCGARVIADFLEKGSTGQLDGRCFDGPARPPFFLTPSGPDPLARATAP